MYILKQIKIPIPGWVHSEFFLNYRIGILNKKKINERSICIYWPFL